MAAKNGHREPSIVVVVLGVVLEMFSTNQITPFDSESLNTSTYAMNN